MMKCIIRNEIMDGKRRNYTDIKYISYYYVNLTEQSLNTHADATLKLGLKYILNEQI